MRGHDPCRADEEGTNCPQPTSPEPSIITEPTPAPTTPEPADLFADKDNLEVAPGVQVRDDGGYCFNGGEAGVAVKSFPRLASAEDNSFVVTIDVTLREGPTPFGYLFSKGAGGSSRYYSAFLRRDGRIHFYYRTVGSEEQQQTVITSEAGKLVLRNTAYRIRLRVVGDLVVTTVTSSSVTESLDTVLLGPVDDCDSPSDTCTLHVGQRTPGEKTLRSACITGVSMDTDTDL